MRAAKGAADYVRDVDYRLRAAAAAHMRALKNDLLPPNPATASQTPDPMVAGMKLEANAMEMAKAASAMGNAIGTSAEAAIRKMEPQIRQAAMHAAGVAAAKARAVLPPVEQVKPQGYPGYYPGYGPGGPMQQLPYGMSPFGYGGTTPLPPGGMYPTMPTRYPGEVAEAAQRGAGATALGAQQAAGDAAALNEAGAVAAAEAAEIGPEAAAAGQAMQDGMAQAAAAAAAPEEGGRFF